MMMNALHFKAVTENGAPANTAVETVTTATFNKKLWRKKIFQSNKNEVWTRSLTPKVRINQPKDVVIVLNQVTIIMSPRQE